MMVSSNSDCSSSFLADMDDIDTENQPEMDELCRRLSAPTGSTDTSSPRLSSNKSPVADDDFNNKVKLVTGVDCDVEDVSSEAWNELPRRLSFDNLVGTNDTVQAAPAAAAPATGEFQAAGVGDSRCSTTTPIPGTIIVPPSQAATVSPETIPTTVTRVDTVSPGVGSTSRPQPNNDDNQGSTAAVFTIENLQPNDAVIVKQLKTRTFTFVIEKKEKTNKKLKKQLKKKALLEKMLKKKFPLAETSTKFDETTFVETITYKVPFTIFINDPDRPIDKYPGQKRLDEARKDRLAKNNEKTLCQEVRKKFSDEGGNVYCRFGTDIHLATPDDVREYMEVRDPDMKDHDAVTNHAGRYNKSGQIKFTDLRNEAYYEGNKEISDERAQQMINDFTTPPRIYINVDAKERRKDYDCQWTFPSDRYEVATSTNVKDSYKEYTPSRNNQDPPTNKKKIGKKKKSEANSPASSTKSDSVASNSSSDEICVRGLLIPLMGEPLRAFILHYQMKLKTQEGTGEPKECTPPSKRFYSHLESLKNDTNPNPFLDEPLRLTAEDLMNETLRFRSDKDPEGEQSAHLQIRETIVRWWIRLEKSLRSSSSSAPPVARGGPGYVPPRQTGTRPPSTGGSGSGSDGPPNSGNNSSSGGQGGQGGQLGKSRSTNNEHEEMDGDYDSKQGDESDSDDDNDDDSDDDDDEFPSGRAPVEEVMVTNDKGLNIMLQDMELSDQSTALGGDDSSSDTNSAGRKRKNTQTDPSDTLNTRESKKCKEDPASMKSDTLSLEERKRSSNETRSSSSPSSSSFVIVEPKDYDSPAQPENLKIQPSSFGSDHDNDSDNDDSDSEPDNGDKGLSGGRIQTLDLSDTMILGNDSSTNNANAGNKRNIQTDVGKKRSATLQPLSLPPSSIQTLSATMMDAAECLEVLLTQEGKYYATSDYLTRMQEAQEPVDPPYFATTKSDEDGSSEDHEEFQSGSHKGKNGSTPSGSDSEIPRSPSKLNKRWRDKICEWVYQVVDDFDLNREVVSIAMSHLDRYLDTCDYPVDKNLFRLIVTTSFVLAIKLNGYNDLIIPGSKSSRDTILQLSRGCFTLGQMEKMEYNILQRLQWHVHPPTPQHFVRQFLYFLSPEEQGASSLATYLAELSVMDYFFVPYKTSEVAMAALLNAVEELLPERSDQIDFSFLGSIYCPHAQNIHTCRERLKTIRLETIRLETLPSSDDISNPTATTATNAKSPTDLRAFFDYF